MDEIKVLDKLADVIELSKEIYNMDDSLGSLLLTSIKLSMDLYEARAKDQFYSVNDIVSFIANAQDMSTDELLSQSYKSCNNETVVDADENLTAFIMNSAKNIPNVDEYEVAVKELVDDFKKSASTLRG